MPNPEPTLAEICKTVRKLREEERAAYTAMAQTPIGTVGRLGSVQEWQRVFDNYARTLDNHALALVQAAEQGEEYRNKMDEIHARETARIGPHGGIDSTDCARAGGMLNAVEEIRQALSSGAPT